MITNGTKTYEYSADNRLILAKNNGQDVASYIFNGLGQRIKKTITGGLTTQYAYGLQGELLVELDAQGLPSLEYYYLNGEPVAMRNVAPNSAEVDVTVDNRDAGAISSTIWVGATSTPGYIGSDYQYFLAGSPPLVPPGGHTIDNVDAAFSTVGTWPISTSPTSSTLSWSF